MIRKIEIPKSLCIFLIWGIFKLKNVALFEFNPFFNINPKICWNIIKERREIPKAKWAVLTLSFWKWNSKTSPSKKIFNSYLLVKYTFSNNKKHYNIAKDINYEEYCCMNINIIFISFEKFYYNNCKIYQKSPSY